ncbi:MAG: c-type cytochrome [Bacteroidota bacterium]
MKQLKSFLLAGGLTAVLFLSSCDRGRTDTGWDYFPDMYYSNAYETNTPNPNFADGLTMRTPVAGTIPREMVPFPYEKTDEDRLLAGMQEFSPLQDTPEETEEGRRMYGIYCIQCHGEQGDGQGYLFTSKRYPYPPANLVNDKVRVLPDGAIYHSISVGYGVMGAHGAMIRPDDRWRIILFIRNELQHKNLQK